MEHTFDTTVAAVQTAVQQLDVVCERTHSGTAKHRRHCQRYDPNFPTEPTELNHVEKEKTKTGLGIGTREKKEKKREETENGSSWRTRRLLRPAPWSLRYHWAVDSWLVPRGTSGVTTTTVPVLLRSRFFHPKRQTQFVGKAGECVHHLRKDTSSLSLRRENIYSVAAALCRTFTRHKLHETSSQQLAEANFRDLAVNCYYYHSETSTAAAP